jgi:hypothetical protein
MTTPSGTITLSNVQTEFGGTNPISLSEYYAGGLYVALAVTGVPTSGTISMNNLRNKTYVPSAGYSVGLSATSINEGSSVTCTLTTTGVADGTVLYWTTGTVTGTINGADFSDSATSGSFTITSNSGSFSRTLTNDVTTEGTEAFNLQIHTGSTAGPVVATSGTITVADTSVAPTYSASWSPSSISEGESSTLTLNTTGVTTGTTIWWTQTGTATGADIVGSPPSSGTITTTGNSTTGTYWAVLDGTSESTETWTVNFQATSGGANVASATLTISDALGTVTTLSLTKTGGASLGVPVSLTAQITSIVAYPVSRAFDLQYSLNGGAYSALSTLTVAASATSSSATTIYSTATTTSGPYTILTKTVLAGHTDKVSNSLTSTYL